LSFIPIVLIVLILGWALVKLLRDVQAGMRLIMALLVFLPGTLRLPLPQGLPQLTVHRLLIVLAFLFLVRGNSPNLPRSRIPNLNLVLIFGLAQGVSFLIGNDFAIGLKAFIGYVIEVLLFYIVISRYVQSEDDVVALLSGICNGLTAVAVVAFVQKQFNIDPVAMLLPEGGSILYALGDVASTYPHRIEMGFALAMGVPLALALSVMAPERKQRRNLYFVVFLLVGATYFSMSRGPWIGLAIGLAGMMLIGGAVLRGKMVVIALLASAILLLRPGVRATIGDLCFATFKSGSDSAKAANFSYRWELWGVAWKEVKTSPLRMFFGYGPNSTESMDLSNYWFGIEGAHAGVLHTGHTSWDNNYAADLIELGLVGLVIEGLLFLGILRKLFENWRVSDGDNRTIISGILISCLLYMFAMSNVFIFAPQLKYAFWALVATGSNFGQILENKSAPDTDLISAASLSAESSAN
jgi:hypothetical protein